MAKVVLVEEAAQAVLQVAPPTPVAMGFPVAGCVVEGVVLVLRVLELLLMGGLEVLAQSVSSGPAQLAHSLQHARRMNNK
jgi:hypothetical protein